MNEFDIKFGIKKSFDIKRKVESEEAVFIRLSSYSIYALIENVFGNYNRCSVIEESQLSRSMVNQ
jgi:hypothetical protein